ncbi:MAG: transcriptional regulator [Acidiferrobacteraceae bacterium]|nr:transcriptional regulator [Acidiferrobacteraceae bacterium]|tara:strand:- start:25865 stop:26170 length:306 start_codon:yes stop_codon:yes gene_type:complete
MKSSKLLDVHPILFDRVRLTIMAHLSFASGPIEFNVLLNDLKLSKGNLSTHIKKLEEKGFVKIEKKFVGRKTRTSYRCTAKGRKEIRHYLLTIELILKEST